MKKPTFAYAFASSSGTCSCSIRSILLPTTTSTFKQVNLYRNKIHLTQSLLSLRLQLQNPLFENFKRVSTCYVIHQKRYTCVFIIHWCQGMVFFLTGCISNLRYYKDGRLCIIGNLIVKLMIIVFPLFLHISCSKGGLGLFAKFLVDKP